MIELPDGFDWLSWAVRWDRMQERYLVGRAERFAVISRLVLATQGPSPLVLDLGCGTGSLMVALLESIPDVHMWGVDLDPTLLPLAGKCLAVFGEQARLALADLRKPSWPTGLPKHFDAVVSSTALHWLSSDQLAKIYVRIAELLHPGGIFLNADHVASGAPLIQQAWRRQRADALAALPLSGVDDWNGFIDAYLAALGPDALVSRQQALGEQLGTEDGFPLDWHFQHLRMAGFSKLDCFWRCDCDAVYGGLRS